MVCVRRSRLSASKSMQFLNKTINIRVLKPFAQQKLPPSLMVSPHLLSHLALFLHHSFHSFTNTFFGIHPILIPFLNFNSNFKISTHEPSINNLISNIWNQNQLAVIHHSLQQRPRTTMSHKATNRSMPQDKLLLHPTPMHQPSSPNSLLEPLGQRRLHRVEPDWRFQRDQERSTGQLKTKNQFLELLLSQDALAPESAVHHGFVPESREKRRRVIFQHRFRRFRNDRSRQNNNLPPLFADVIGINPFHLSRGFEGDGVAVVERGLLSFEERDSFPELL
ncbi:hypothetical protein TorRG33x02_294260 [Trema orientale]|uniref:Uncharacterized protein n=1 Tax=Trema orientale TaxID=63057 RepID=A0A2P5C7T4_TREOI|nr:hypothetical protein TorRG33x02_294260 [Trema orientale]